MKSTPESSLKAETSLRRRATEKLKKRTLATKPEDVVSDLERLLHELQVHQIELEMQNEELRSAQEKVESERARYQDLYDFSPVAYFSGDREGTVTEANLTCSTLLGTERSQLVQHPFHSFVAQPDRPRWRAFLERIFASSVGESCELTLLAQGRDAVEVQLDAKGDPMGREFRAAVWDLTDRRRIEAERLQLNKFESAGILAGGIAHDFNNLLTAIMVNLELCEARMKAGRGMDLHLRDAIAATERASDLIQEFLTISSGHVPLRQISDLSALIAESVHLALSGSKVQAEIVLPENLWPVDVDVGQIGQVIRNLVQNAREAMPDRGTVSVTVANLIRGPGERPSLPPGDYVRISVADSGCGIPRETIAKIFDPYFSTKKRGQQKGMGLGLTVSHSIIQKHGGGIDVVAAPGGGSIFQVDLPASVRCVTEAETMRARAPMPACRILLIEEVAWVRKALGESLRTMGHDIALIESEGEVLEAYGEALEIGKPYDLVLLDLMVCAEGDCTAILAALRSLDPAARVIAMVGNAREPMVREFARFGFNAVLAKPIDTVALRDVILQALRA